MVQARASSWTIRPSRNDAIQATSEKITGATGTKHHVRTTITTRVASSPIKILLLAKLHLLSQESPTDEQHQKARFNATTKAATWTSRRSINLILHPFRSG